jgi:hypothetical protein
LDIQRAITDWWQRSGRAVDALYAHARSIEEPRFDFEPALEQARRLKEGLTTPGRPQTVVKGVDEAGQPITEEVIPDIRLDELSPGLRREIDKILALDPDFPTKEGAREISATDRIREIIKNLRDESLAPPEGKRESQHVATSLRETLKDILDNPANADPEFVRRWTAANRAAFDRFTTREHLAVVDAINSGTPSEIADQLIINAPKSIDNMIAIRQATDKETFLAIRSEFIGKVLRKPGQLTETLDNFHPDVLRMLLPKAERRAMRAAAIDFDQLYKRSNLAQAIDRQIERRGFVRELIDTKNTASIEALHKIVEKQGGRDSPFGLSIRAAVMDEIRERALEQKGGHLRISGKAIRDTLRDFDQRGVTRFLTEADRGVLKDIELIQTMTDMAVTDAGTAIKGAETAAGVFQGAQNALIDAVHLFGVSKVLLYPRVTKALIHAKPGAKGFDTRTIQLAGSLALTLATDIRKDSDSPEFQALRRITTIAKESP